MARKKKFQEDTHLFPLRIPNSFKDFLEEYAEKQPYPTTVTDVILKVLFKFGHFQGYQGPEKGISSQKSEPEQDS